MPWSEAQLKAITTYDKNLLVAAAAGSGKTSVLVERIIRRVLDKKCNIDEVLVVTFTNAAAAEMRERIGQALNRALEEEPGSGYLQRQLVLMNTASISTMHAFCQSVIRQNFHVLDIDPKFRLANEQEIRLLQRDVLETLFEEKYEQGDKEFLQFVDCYGNERSDEALYDIVLKLYNYSCSQPFPRTWLESLPKHFNLAEDMAIEQTEWMPLVCREIELELSACWEDCNHMLQMADELGCEFYRDVLEGDKELIESLQVKLESPWDELQTAFCVVKFATMRAPKGTDEEIKDIFKQQRQKIKDRVNALKDTYFLMEGPDLMADLRSVVPLMTGICNLVEEFSITFAKAKHEKTIADFNDLEHFALQVLLNEEAVPEKLIPSVAAERLQAKYKEVMVDEYQDTNGVQEAILSLVTKKNAAGLFLVGDVKQSIYRFRLAEPELFLQKYHAYPQMGDEYERIDLARNFRSRPEVLLGINYVFAQIMSEKAVELSYGEEAALHPGSGYPVCAGKSLAGPIEIDIIDKDDKEQETVEECNVSDEDDEELRGFALEAQYIAERLKKLMQAEQQVFDKQTKSYRPLAWRDIVVLLRSVKGKANVLLETFRANDIPAYASVDAGYFQEIEVQVMLALLGVIDNPQQDIPLAAVLYSPIGGMDAAELAKIRLLSEETNLFTALLQAADPAKKLKIELKDKAMEFIMKLNGWRNLARRTSVPELIWQLFRDTGYYDYVGGMPGGLLRQANLRMLYDRAEEYETTNFRGLFRFLRFIEKIQNAGTDLAVARTLSESENVVRIMSIHKSKGLEFPVVVAADLGKNFNLLDSRAVLLMHKKYGLGPYVNNTELSVRYPTFARQAISAEINHESKAEEIRVLYVALTRAREKLILVGSAGKLASRADEWCRQIASTQVLLPDHKIAGAKSYLDWICSAVARHEDGKVLRELAQTMQPHHNIDYDLSSHWKVRIVPAGRIKVKKPFEAEIEELLKNIRAEKKLSSTEAKQWVEQRLNYHYPDSGAAEVPAKLSVTELKRRFEQTEKEAASLLPEKIIFKRPQFVQSTTKLTGAEYGTIMHSVMQHIDLKGDLSHDGIAQQIDGFVTREILLAEQKKAVNIKSIHKFFTLDLGQRLLQAKAVQREMPFSRMLPAKRFYKETLDDTSKIFIQGIIDVLFEEKDGLVLIDYKTDKSTQPDELIARYKLQIELYSEAAEAILKKKIKEKYLYLLHDGSTIQM
jgi:ATP-dependent helicase/nuclease subunit A